MRIIGLTGGTGAGKGTVAALFSKYNFAVIDTDAIYRSMTESPSPCLDALKNEFGDSIVKDGALDRKALSALVFAQGNKDKLDRLNEITHKFILDEVRARLQEIKSLGYAAALVDAPLLFESGFDSECDSILCITAEKNVRLRRIMERDGITYDKALARLSAQLDDSELISRSDFVISNDEDLDALECSVESVAKQILNN